MAWYRAGGGGIPSSLKTGMDSVLNKKFGTSTTYPAEDWPDTVNLMGPLPEKTVSGAIVTFADGADAVPLKKCEVTLPASLDGYSEVDVVATGANLFTAELETGNIGTSGQDEPNAGQCRTHGFILIAPDTMCISYVSDKRFGCFWYDENQDFISFLSWQSAPRAITPPATAKYVRFSFETSIYPTNLMLNVGTTAETYEAPTAPTTHTADLGRTIHGGAADVVKGQGSTKVNKQTYTGDNVGTVSITYGQADEGYTHLYFNIADIPLAYNPTSDNVISNITLPWNNNASAAGIPAVGECWRLINGGSPQKPIIYMYIHQTWANLSDFKTWLNANPISVVYEVADETTFTFDPVPIDSKLGANTIWSDQGDTEVTYRADINLALGGQ